MTPSAHRWRVGTAGWSIPRAVAPEFPGEGSHLERYARVLPCAEINSSFYRSHARAVYQRWADSTPSTFRFSVKMPRAITHDAGLRRARLLLEHFLSEAATLGPRLGPLLVQLPPSLELNVRVAGAFFRLLRERHRGPVVCEPRHGSWFEAGAERVLAAHQIARVATDPTRYTPARTPGGWAGPAPDGSAAVAYYRLHGSPRKYWSSYSPERIATWSAELDALPAATEAWCIFDNTASGAAARNALELWRTESAQRAAPGHSITAPAEWR